MTLVFKQMKKMPSSLIVSKLQISTTVKYHFSPRLSEIKKFDTLYWKWEIGSYILFFWWESTLIVLEGNLTIPIKCETYLRLSSFISRYLSHSKFYKSKMT